MRLAAHSRRHPISAATYFVMGAILGIPGVYDAVSGFARDDLGDTVNGITNSLTAALLIYCALVCRHGDAAKLSTPAFKLISYAALAMCIAGVTVDLLTW